MLHNQQHMLCNQHHMLHNQQHMLRNQQHMLHNQEHMLRNQTKFVKVYFVNAQLQFSAVAALTQKRFFVAPNFDLIRPSYN